MTTDTDTTPETVTSESTDWVDIRMTDPEKGEWAVDVIAIDGRIDYVDLRIRESLLASFVDCLLSDVRDEVARDVLEDLLERRTDGDEE